MRTSKTDIINQLQRDILLWQGYKPVSAFKANAVGLGLIEQAFPNNTFPTGTIHELLTGMPEHAASTNGFLAGILKTFMQQGKPCVWISQSNTLFPPSVKLFGIEPDKFLFVTVKRQRDILWVMEEALKCEGLAAVIAELREISFAQSRRLQLVVEKSKVTGFIIRTDLRKLSTTACVARWKVTPLISQLEEDMPGVGLPRWQVELLRVRNGNPGKWQVEWLADRFNVLPQKQIQTAIDEPARKTG